MKLFKTKKAQLTIFIILGLMILFGSALLFYVKTKVSENQSFEDIVGTVPVELAPVKEYVEKCMYDLGKDAIILVGETGGYIQMDSSMIKNVPSDPTLGEGIELVEGTDVMVPYWYYLDGPNDCQKLEQGRCKFSNDLIPTLKKESPDDFSIENQISMYVEEKFADCINKFLPFEEMSIDISEVKEPIFDTIITSKEVKLNLKYPINIKKGNTETQMEYFVQKFDVKLEYAYWLAYQIVKKEMENYYLEQSLANLLTIFGDIDSKIPPMYGGMNFAADAPMGGWSKKVAKQEIQNILYPYTSNFKVTNTLSQFKIIPSENEKSWDFVINKMNYLIDLDFNYFFPLDVQFIYMPNWPIHLDITPSSGDKVLPEKTSTQFLEYLGLGMTRYDFSFDVSYPVLVELKEYTSFNKEGYSFYFAMEANMRNNKALMAPSSDNYLKAEGQPEDGVAKLLCKDQGKRTGEISVMVYDSFTLEPLDNAQVMSSFGRSSCMEGVTNSKGDYTGKFQSGIGDLSVKKADYLDYRKNYIFGINKKDVQMIYLYPKQEILVKPYEVIFDQASGFNEYHVTEVINGTDKTLMVRLERIEDEVSNEKIQATVAFSDDFEPQTIDLYPGKYKIAITYINKNNFTAPLTVDCNIESCIIFNETSMPLNMRLDIDEPEYYFEVIPEKLYASHDLDVYAPIPEVYKEQYIMTMENMMMIDMEDTYKRFYEVLKPKLK